MTSGEEKQMFLQTENMEEIRAIQEEFRKLEGMSDTEALKAGWIVEVPSDMYYIENGRKILFLSGEDIGPAEE
ncbi:MAG: hypothetical protein HDR21_12150 [Lachnospiraceae bacterium]|nr:hypothetical protein [Lachnospiraceae bacterium]